MKDGVRYKLNSEFKMAAVKPELRLSSLVDNKETKLQRQTPCFQGQKAHWN